jgi:hypothetical protein
MCRLGVDPQPVGASPLEIGWQAEGLGVPVTAAATSAAPERDGSDAPQRGSHRLSSPFVCSGMLTLAAGTERCLYGAIRISTELMNHRKSDALWMDTSFVPLRSKDRVPAQTTTDSPAGTGPALNSCAK